MGSIAEETKKSGRKAYRVDIRLNKIRTTKRFRRLTDAKAWMQSEEAKINRGEAIFRIKPHPLSETIDRYIKEVLPLKGSGTQEFQISQLEWFKVHFGSIYLHQLTVDHLSQARTKLLTEVIQRKGWKHTFNRKPSTVNRYFQILTHCLNVAKNDWGWVQNTPRLKKLKESEGRSEYLTPDEARAISKKLKEGARDVYLVARISNTVGSRLEETCALTWKDVDFENDRICFRKTKTGKVRVVPMPSGLKDELQEWKANRYPFPPPHHCPSK